MRLFQDACVLVLHALTRRFVEEDEECCCSVRSVVDRTERTAGGITPWLVTAYSNLRRMLRAAMASRFQIARHSVWVHTRTPWIGYRLSPSPPAFFSYSWSKVPFL